MIFVFVIMVSVYLLILAVASGLPFSAAWIREKERGSSANGWPIYGPWIVFVGRN